VLLLAHIDPPAVFVVKVKGSTQRHTRFPDPCQARERAGTLKSPGQRQRYVRENPCYPNREVRRISLIATIPEPTNRARTVAANREMRGMPPVSGNTPVEADAEGLALLVALPLVGLAEAEVLLIALVVAEAEALLVVLAEAEALEAGLATLWSSNPRSSIPLSSKPRSSIPLASKPRSSAPRASIPLSSKPRSSAPLASIPLSSAPISSSWAAATGAKTNTANATDKTSKMDLRTVSPRLCLHIHDKDAPFGAG